MLRTEFLGLKMKSPIVVAAGPWSRGQERIEELYKAGAGAIVTETIVSVPNIDVRPRLAYNGLGLENIRLFSGMPLEQWIDEISEIKKNRKGKDELIIANILAHTPSEIAYIAKKIEKAGADAIEVGLACPMGSGIEVIASDPELAFKLTEATVSAVNIPVIVKLSQSMRNVPEIIAAVEKAGVKGISAIDTVRCILGIDVNKRKPILPSYGGYSGEAIRPLGLASVAAIAQSSKLPICGIGGISSAENALEYMMVGAKTVGIGTAIFINGPKFISKIKADLESWMRENNLEKLDDICGVALEKLMPLDEITVEPLVAYIKDNCVLTPEECGFCINCCIDNAISYEDKIYINKESCTGCGLCVDVCPKKAIELVWK